MHKPYNSKSAERERESERETERPRERPRETERDRASEPASSTPGFDFVGKMFNKVYRALKHDYGNSSRVLKGACRMEFVKIRESILVESFI